MSPQPVIGIDVGGTKIVAAVVSGDHRILRRASRRFTPDANSSSLFAELLAIVQELRALEPAVAAVGVGVAGLVHWPDGVVEFAANHGHRQLKLKDKLGVACRLPVLVDNDANAAAWAETADGEYEGQGVLYLAIGTGLGSGFVVDGHMMRGQSGRGAELGHIVVEHENPQSCPCGLTGCLETVASGNALKYAGQQIVRQSPSGLLAKRLRAGTKIDIAMMIDAALDDDPEVVPVVARMGRLIGKTIAKNSMSLLPVDRIIVGGGLSVLDRQLLDPMRHACEKALGRSRLHHPPRITRALHQEDATLLGAARLAASGLNPPIDPTPIVVTPVAAGSGV